MTASRTNNDVFGLPDRRQCRYTAPIFRGPALGISWRGVFSLIIGVATNRDPPVVFSIASEQAFTSDRLFMDVDHIGPGQDFVRVLEDEVSKCEILLAVIGKGWIDARDEKGQRRLDNPNDFVRIEIESALKQGKHLIPVLINDAQMPRGDDLPKNMKDLSRRNAVRIVHERFRSDAQGLVKILETSLAKIEAARALKTEEERKAAEDALRRKQEEEAARSAEAERQAEQRARQQSAQGLSPDEIRKAEELANWDFIKGASSIPRAGAIILRVSLAASPSAMGVRPSKILFGRR